MRLTWALKRRPDIEKEFPFARPDLRIGYPVEPVSVTQIYQSQYREEYAGAETHRPLNLKRRKLAGIQIGVTSIHKSVGIDLGDRKSTRLNSSHVAISYAVFCLKIKHRHNRFGGARADG